MIIPWLRRQNIVIDIPCWTLLGVIQLWPHKEAQWVASKLDLGPKRWIQGTI